MLVPLSLFGNTHSVDQGKIAKTYNACPLSQFANTCSVDQENRITKTKCF